MESDPLGEARRGGHHGHRSHSLFGHPQNAAPAMTPGHALDAIEKALAASLGKGSSKEERDVALVTDQAPEGVRKDLADLVRPSSVERGPFN